MHHVGEQDGDLFVFSPSSHLCEWRAALVTELGVWWQFDAARPTEQPRRGQSTATIPAGSTSASFHRWSTTGRPTTGLRRNSKLRPVSFKDCIGPLQFTVIPSKECHTKPTSAQQTATDFRASRMSYSRHDYLGGWPTAACVRGSLKPGVKDFFAQLIAETTPRAPTPGRIMNGDRQADPSPRQAAQSQAGRVTH